MPSDEGLEERRRKAQDFLWIVQTGLLAIAGSVRRSDPGRDGGAVAAYSGTGVFIAVDEAVRAAGLIPNLMSAQSAAAAFCDAWTLPRSQSGLPPWCSRYGEEQHDYTVVNKAEQFLWVVQTAALADAENQASFDAKAKRPERFGPNAIIETMSQAVRVARSIPSQIEATEAANEFLAFYSAGMKERRAAPKWCKP